jgi:tetratricopeptide (TPR) repeat protein
VPEFAKIWLRGGDLAEETEWASSGPEGNGAGIDPTAVALALAGASREEADNFLRNQNGLIADQRHHLHEQLKQIHLDIFEKWLGVLLRLATLCVGIAAAGAISLLVWNAAHADGLVIESFSVPPEIAEHGLTGQVIASQVLDGLTTIMNVTSRSARAAKSYSSNWGNDIKVDIPESGISVGDAYRFLKSWLGHESHISGDVTRTSAGIAIRARVSGQNSVTVTGTEVDVDAMIQRIAEQIVGQTQPYRYGVYLLRQGRTPEAIVVLKSLATTGPAQEHVWGFLGWSIALQQSNASIITADGVDRQALSVQAENYQALSNLSIDEEFLGREEEALRLRNRAQSILDSGKDLSINPLQIPAFRKFSPASIKRLKGAFGEAAQDQSDAIEHGLQGPISPYFSVATPQVAAHDIAAARSSIHSAFVNLADNSAVIRGPIVYRNAARAIAIQMAMDGEAGDWNGLLAHAKGLDPLLAKNSGLREDFSFADAPLIALAQAHLGAFGAAETAIASTSGACGPCLRTRAQIAELRGQHWRADWWFERAIENAPSIPFAYSEWGKALLNRGKPDDAIAEFKLALDKGPHFADPLEGWGEALMAKNQSHLALAKFAEAEKYAPNWGRLHVKWGEALFYAGRMDEAKAQFARAAALDLTSAEKFELAAFRHV